VGSIPNRGESFLLSKASIPVLMPTHPLIQQKPETLSVEGITPSYEDHHSSSPSDAEFEHDVNREGIYRTRI
jgi:hypothetical protein